MNSLLDQKIEPGLRPAEEGFSLLEMMIAMVIFGIITGAIYGLLKVARGDRFTTNQRSEVMHNTRIALNTVGFDSLNAGFDYPPTGATLGDDKLNALLGLPTDPDEVEDRLEPVIAGNDINSIPNLSGGDTLTDQVTFIYRDMTFNNGNVLRTTTAKDTVNNDGSEIFLDEPNAGLVKRNDLLLISGSAGGPPAIAVVTDPNIGGSTLIFGASDPWQANTVGPKNPILGTMVTEEGNETPASITRVYLVTYRVIREEGPDHILNTGDDLGVLIRRVVGNDPAEGERDMPIAYGVEDMQIRYVMDDGSVEDSIASAQAGPDRIFGTLDDIRQPARQVRITIKSRGPEIDERIMQTSNVNNAPTQRRLPHRVEMSSAFNLRNIAYDTK